MKRRVRRLTEMAARVTAIQIRSLGNHGFELAVGDAKGTTKNLSLKEFTH